MTAITYIEALQKLPPLTTILNAHAGSLTPASEPVVRLVHVRAALRGPEYLYCCGEHCDRCQQLDRYPLVTAVVL